MELTELKHKIDLALNELYSRDSFLLNQNLSEWSIAHRLAVYLEDIIPGWNVDCEYNRQGQDADAKKMLDDKKVRPDIIIHRRGLLESEHNLLAVEIKKNNTESDDDKVCEYTKAPTDHRKFQYKYGLSLSFKPSLKLTWFKDGEALNE